ncbi:MULTISPECIES: UdgX family uracil-DNA binding protein [unclassified Janthinobacterium]|uniref:UdgX family uracil-DNA binding protein n=1 Tax=unclassified Janthinobacterium TaxID=2610881 RepID=UPI0003462582|nr:MULTISPECIES: UdgX family uracil-DNA binding protein [unclassified Janthinobacterium]MEC5163749.1 putative DNA metabolism protein [Janthinobacterium sp. CG_S6]
MAGAANKLTPPDAVAAVSAGQPVLAQCFEQWRDAARQLLAHDIAPHAVQWISRPGDGDLLAGIDDAVARPRAPCPAAGAMQLPRRLVDLLQTAARFRADARWALLYRVVWRWRRGERDVMSAADPDGARLHAMVKAVQREQHDMHAYVRFRERPEAAGAPRFVAWYEPVHDVLAQVAPHFAARMGGATWMIATPEATVLWDGAALHSLPPRMRGAADVDDAGEALWLTYYRSIFNPARLNRRLLHSHIPARFWKNLPEGAVVPAMLAQAAAGARRTGQAPGVAERAGSVVRIAAGGAGPRRDGDGDGALAQCRRCELWRHATQAVDGAGPATAPIMLVGEQPGDQEDLAGLPFVGPAGAVLERALALAGLARDAVYITNAVKHFKWEPRGKRRLHKTPAQQEVDACRVWLEREIERGQPAVVVALGATALKAVLGDAGATLKQALGRPLRHQGRWVLALYHPSYVLRLPDAAARQQALDVIVAGLARARQLRDGRDG